jgi:hypothetical protein
MSRNAGTSTLGYQYCRFALLTSLRKQCRAVRFTQGPLLASELMNRSILNALRDVPADRQLVNLDLPYLADEGA